MRASLGWLLTLMLLPPCAARGQQIHQNGFESRGPYWKAGSTDAALKVIEHHLTDETAKGGQRSEHLRLQVERGSFIHYTLDLPRAPVNDELSLSLWVKSNRPGVQLLCRLVLPRERDPKDPAQPLTVLVRCDPYNSTRWKLLSLREPARRLREQQALLTRELGHEVVTTGAYIDRLVLNAYDGPGQIDVWTDDLSVGPVEEAKRPVAEAAPASRAGGAPVSRAAEVQLRGNQLWVGGKRFFLRGIRATGTPPMTTLREANFNVLWLDESTPPGLVEEASSLGFYLVPTLQPPRLHAGGPGEVEGTLASRADEFNRKVSRFAEQDSVLAWDLGSNLGAERFPDVARLAKAFRLADPRRPVLADVWDGYRGYSRSLDQMMLGTHRWPLMTSLELPAYREWLDMRRRLASDAYCWTWIQTHLPDWFLRLGEQSRSRGDFAEPIGPQPEQIRLLAYTAIAAGYRGLAFWSDRFLADSHQGKDRLLAMALLNLELTMIERLLVSASGAPEVINTSRPEVIAAVFRGPEGVLALPVWVGPGSQYVPGQAASAELSLTVPGVPVTATAWEVSPGRIQSYPIHRDLGGSTVKLRNFSLTSAVLFTSDLSPTGPVVWLQSEQRKKGRLAAQWLHEQAEEELRKVKRVQAELDRMGHGVSDATALLDRAEKALQQSLQHRRNHEHAEAYNQAEVALRSVRVLMRASWERAVRDLDMPVASPYGVSYYTLPRHWKLLDRMKQSRPGASVLPDGDFEVAARQEQAGWLLQEVPSLDDVETSVRRVQGGAHGGKQCLMMQVSAKDTKREPAALERTYVALHSPRAKLPPGTLVRVSAWVKIPKPIRGSVDGALFFDTVGGEPLAVRLTGEVGQWKRFSLYREVPASGQVGVTLAMSGLGTVFFDDVRIEPLLPAGPETTGTPPSAARGSRR
ncbi:MAG: hypothetical protein U0797_17250 [Gemmataceae bacterium]